MEEDYRPDQLAALFTSRFSRKDRTFSPDFDKAKEMGVEIIAELDRGITVSRVTKQVTLADNRRDRIIFLTDPPDEPQVAGLMRKLTPYLDPEVLAFCRAIDNTSHHIYNLVCRPVMRQLLMEAPFAAAVAVRAFDSELLVDPLTVDTTPRIVAALARRIAAAVNVAETKSQRVDKVSVEDARKTEMPRAARKILNDNSVASAAALAWIASRRQSLPKSNTNTIKPARFARIVAGLANVHESVVIDAGIKGRLLLEEAASADPICTPLIFTSWSAGLARLEMYAHARPDDANNSRLSMFDGLSQALREEFGVRLADHRPADVDKFLMSIKSEVIVAKDLPILIGLETDGLALPYVITQIRTTTELAHHARAFGFRERLPKLIRGCDNESVFAFAVFNGDECEAVVSVNHKGRVPEIFGHLSVPDDLFRIRRDLERRFESSSVLIPEFDIGGPF